MSAVAFLGWFGLVALGVGILAAHLRLGQHSWTILLLACAALLQLAVTPPPGAALPAWLLLLSGITVLNLRSLRRRLVAPLLSAARDAPPWLSAQERATVESGTVGWDAALFSGKPDWRTLLDTPAGGLTAAEHAFLSGPVETLCAELDDWHNHASLDDLPERVWQLIRDDGYLGLAIPRSHGGLGFSARATSDILLKLASRSQSAAVTVMAPNALGLGQLLLRYGTPAQRRELLPALASGDEIPCFALTGPFSGSDTASMQDEGIVCHDDFEGRRTLGIRLTWNKRYITLAPVATLMGLAIRVRDPDGLLAPGTATGITCCLLPVGRPGVVIGRRHRPGGAVFMNGPTEGRDVFIPMDWVVGGAEQLGRGWEMLLACMPASRAIGLPALATAGAKFAAATTGAYARIRKQFHQPIGRFEGVAEVLGRMAGETYRMDAARRLVAALVDRGEQPAIPSAILKYHATEGYRRVVNDAMDIHAGKAVIDGPSNYLARIYQAVPIAITVEGANIVTRSLVMFGQGVLRCHPCVLKEIAAVAEPDRRRALRAFDAAVVRHAGLFLSNLVRAALLGLTGARTARAPATGRHADGYRQIERMSAAFALTSDVALFTVGGKLRDREALSGRLADVLAQLFLASATLKRHLDDGEPEADGDLVEWAVRDSLHRAQVALVAALENFPHPRLGRALRRWILPFGNAWKAPDDTLTLRAAATLLDDGAVRQRLLEGIYRSGDPADAAGAVEDAFRKVLAAAPAEAAIRNALNTEVNPLNVDELAARGLATGVLTAEQAEALRSAQEAVARAIEVDAFPGRPRAVAGDRRSAAG